MIVTSCPGIVPVTLPKSAAPVSVCADSVFSPPWSITTPASVYPVMAEGEFTATASPPAYDRDICSGSPFTAPPVAESRYTKDTVYPFRLNTVFLPFPRPGVPALV